MVKDNRGGKRATPKFTLEPGYKQVRVNKQYGEWAYHKEYDPEDNRNYMYSIYGIDANGKEWGWTTPFYNEINEFIKGDEKHKNYMIKTY